MLFVHDPVPGQAERDASDAAHAVADELRRLLALPVPDPALAVDADLRPEGRQGPLVRTLAAYRSYYRGGPRRGRRRPCCALRRRPGTRIWGPASSG